jgi:hypothetical protein
MLQLIFTILVTLQFIAVVFHDMIDIPGWAHGRQVREIIGRRKFWIATFINAIFPGLAVGFVFWFWNGRAPALVANYWMIYCGITLLSAIWMWYVPYIFGCRDEVKRMYSRMYEGTIQVLPARGENPRPNLLHLLFHLLFVVNFVLAVALRRQATQG